MNSSRTFSAGIIALCLFLFTSGCAKNHQDIIGTWIPNNVPKGIEMALELKSNGTWIQSVKDSKHTMSASGTYTTNKYSLNLTELKTAVDNEDKGSGKNYKYTYKVKWMKNDEIELTQFNNPTIYKRKK